MARPIITRFAPSPTGFLHVGGARTALYNYIHAVQHGGVFRLRVEDTDKKRSSAEMTRRIFDGLKWLGLQWDDSVIHQGERADRHREIAHLLEGNGSVYPCFCTREELEINRHNFQYNGHCRKLTPKKIRDLKNAGIPYSLRFKVPPGNTSWTDIIHGKISVENQELEDFIVLRSDGSPVYQLAVVIDDHDMDITYIIRGDDHISNTPKQLLLYQALDWQIPHFAHVPLILGPDKKRLSKRHGAASVEEYQNMGILPEALFNFLVLMGWLPENNQEILSRHEILNEFSLDHISRKSAVFDEKKLAWMNQQHIIRTPPSQLLKLIHPLWQKAQLIPNGATEHDEEWEIRIIELLKPRAVFLTDFIELALYFFQAPRFYDPEGFRKYMGDEPTWLLLERIISPLESINEFTSVILENIIRKFAVEQQVGAGKVIHPLRLALTGRTATPGLFEVMELLSQKEVLVRLKGFLENKEALNKSIMNARDTDE